MAAVFIYKDKNNEIIASDKKFNVIKLFNIFFQVNYLTLANYNFLQYNGIRKGVKIILINCLTFIVSLL
jgi:hypothetical protein